MFSVMLLTISTVALAQFAVYYWRSVLAGVAAKPISEDVLVAANVKGGTLSGRDFRAMAELHELTPNLEKRASSLCWVSAYYEVIHAIGALAAGRLAALADWAEREQVLCARYAAVQVDRRLQANVAQLAAVRSC